jgi:hypothetical protein
MRTAFGSLIFWLALAGCAVQTSTKPVEYLDERTAATVGALKDPIEFTPSLNIVAADKAGGKQISFAYLGPVEWDKAGAYAYGLWVHVTGGSNWTPADIHTPGSVSIVLDDASLALVPMDGPKLGRDAYKPVASWGQTGYFELSVKMLQRMAASQKLNLEVRGADGNASTFVPVRDTRPVLGEFVRARSLTGD